MTLDDLSADPKIQPGPGSHHPFQNLAPLGHAHVGGKRIDRQVRT